MQSRAWSVLHVSPEAEAVVDGFLRSGGTGHGDSPSGGLDVEFVQEDTENIKEFQHYQIGIVRKELANL